MALDSNKQVEKQVTWTTLSNQQEISMFFQDNYVNRL